MHHALLSEDQKIIAFVKKLPNAKQLFEMKDNFGRTPEQLFALTKPPIPENVFFHYLDEELGKIELKNGKDFKKLTGAILTDRDVLPVDTIYDHWSHYWEVPELPLAYAEMFQKSHRIVPKRGAFLNLRC